MNNYFRFTLPFCCLGDGKTHYIKKQLVKHHKTIIAVNEAFSVPNTISKLRMLPIEQNCAIHFNFTIIPPSTVSFDCCLDVRLPLHCIVKFYANFYYRASQQLMRGQNMRHLSTHCLGFSSNY